MEKETIIYTDEDRSSDFDCFVDNYDDLYKKYGHKYIVIKNKQVLGVYDTVVEAIDITTQKYPLGSFIVQECDGTEDAYTAYISSPWIISID